MGLFFTFFKTQIPKTKYQISNIKYQIPNTKKADMKFIA